jgi:hypothetical protein
LEDFGVEESSAALFYSWNGYSLLCPDIPKDDGLIL